MALDNDRIDNATLALTLLGLHEGDCAWKSFDWKAVARLHAEGLISYPAGRSNSVVFTAEGEARAESLLEVLFGQTDRPRRAS